MTAFPNPAYDGQLYTLGLRSWTYILAQDAWILNKNGPTGPTGTPGVTGPAGVLLTNLTVDTFTGDGVTDTFELSITPVSAYNMIVNIDGLVQTAFVNYTLSGTNIAFTSIPINNSTIDVVHFLTGSAITGPRGYLGPTGPAGGPTGPTGSSSSNTETVNVSSTGTNANFYPTWVSTTGTSIPLYAGPGLSYNPSNVTLSISGNILVQDSSSFGNIRVTNTTTSTGTTSGALTVAGGAGIVGNAYVGGDIVSSSNVHANGGMFRTTSSNAYIVNSTPTTVFIAGGATNAVVMGSSTGHIFLNGNVQGSTNGFAIGYRDIPQIPFTGNTTITGSDAGKHYYSTQSSNFTLTVANSATVGFTVGTAINVINQGDGTITIEPASGTTLYLAGNATPSSITLASYGMATIHKVATDTWFCVGVGLT